MFDLQLMNNENISEKKRSFQVYDESKHSIKVAIAGGGAGGVGTALELANAGYRVDLYEKRNDLLSATSNKTPGRAGHGYHYVHQKTAELYLRATIEVVRRYPNCLLGYGHPETHYLRHGLYCIMKQKEELSDEQAQFASIYPKELILQTYNSIKECYRALVAEDISNQVFGDPDNFNHVLSSLEMEKYKDTINLDIVDTIVDTREELLNWPKLRSILMDKVKNHPNITLHLNASIDSPQQRSHRMGFNFTVNGKPAEADVFINATWEGIERLNQKISIYMEPDSRTNRLKTIITAQLPEKLKEHPSVFFCMGPHAMISNMGNGTVMSTYAQVTNISLSTGLFISKEAEQCLNGVGQVQEEIQVANKIIDGVSHYFPSIKDARLIGKGYGIVKTRGGVDLFDPNSEVNKREEIGVEEQLLGWIDNACMKLLHFVLNGKEVLALVEQVEHAQKVIHSISATVIAELYKKQSPKITFGGEDVSINVKMKVLENMLVTFLQRYTEAASFSTYKDKMQPSLFKSMSAKDSAMKSLQDSSLKPRFLKDGFLKKFSCSLSPSSGEMEESVSSVKSVGIFFPRTKQLEKPALPRSQSCRNF